MRWVLGLDLDERSLGALRLAAWLRRQCRADAPPEFIGVHVLEERLRPTVADEIIEGLAPALADHVRRLTAHADVTSPITDIRVQWGPSAETELARVAESCQATGLLVGRIARTDARAIDRLGRVARRLLRRLPVPVLVVPPDYGIAPIGTGPIVLATDLESWSVHAGEVAARLAKELDRELAIVHVDDTLYLASAAAPEGVLSLATFPRRSPAEVADWAREHGLPTERVRLVEGERVAATIDAAREADAPIIVCGSRRLSVTERLFASSMASELARFADRAVLTVPPTT